MNLLSLTLLTTGGVLIYSAIKGKNPVDVVKSSLTGKGPGAAPAVYGMTPTPPATSGGAKPTTDPVDKVVGV